MIIDIIRNTLMITSFVMVMMLLIEYINVVSKGNRIKNLQGSPGKQILIAALLGLVPGCLGGFVVVSLFTHNILNFGAMVACMIAAFGDEAFVMFAVIPETAILLSAIIFIIAIVTGFVVNIFVKKFPTPFSPAHFAIHASDHAHADMKGNWKHNLKHISFERAILMTGIVIVIVAILAGWFEHSHGDAHIHDGHECHGHGHHHDHSQHGGNINDIEAIVQKMPVSKKVQEDVLAVYALIVRKRRKKLPEQTAEQIAAALADGRNVRLTFKEYEKTYGNRYARSMRLRKALEDAAELRKNLSAENGEMPLQFVPPEDTAPEKGDNNDRNE